MAATTSACLGGLAYGVWNMGQPANWDSRSFAQGLALTGRGNTVSQSFDRRFAAIDYKIQRQQLHREDIRDLVELTTSRMDIYNLVGTLLLTFCITWFTDTAIIENGLPRWFADLFLISNFSAVGYLTMSVWMAMYAAVASKAIGVRLLTSYNRLALPVQDDLDEIKIPIFFSTDKLFSCARRLLGQTSATASDNAAFGDFKRNSAREIPTNDDLQHFRRFLYEAPRWLKHDTYSRVCMSMGMNQMLQALAYNIISFVWIKSPMAASLCFVAVKILSIIIMRLDFSGSGEDRSQVSVYAVACFYTLPPLIASSTLWFPILSRKEWSEITVGEWNGLAASVFFLHACWLGYIAYQLHGVEKSDTQFQPGQFANVLEWVEERAADQNLILEAQACCKKLRDNMEDQEQHERASGIISVPQRDSATLRILAHDLNEANAKLAIEADHAAIQHQRSYAEQVLHHFSLWTYAPKVWVTLAAFRTTEVQRRLTEPEKRTIEESYIAFESTCRKLNLGMISEGHLLEVDGRDMPTVRIFTPREGEAPLVEWIDPQTGRVSTKDPFPAVALCFRDMTESVLPPWKELSAHVRDVGLPPVVEGQVTSADNASKGPRAVNGGVEPGRWAGAPHVELKASDARLPYKCVLAFTLGTMIWWFVCGLSRAYLSRHGTIDDIVDDIVEEHANHMHPHRSKGKVGNTSHDNQSKPSFLGWPEPASLFKVEALHCNASHLWITSKFAVLNTKHDENKYACTLNELDQAAMNAIICGQEFCNSLRPAAHGGHWLLEFLESREASAVPIPVPRTWRVVTGAWTKNCPLEHSVAPCGEATLVGWDGSAVVVAKMHQEQSTGTWKIRPRFALDPLVALCTNSWAGCAFWTSSERNKAKYLSVKAIQLSTGGRAVIILLGSGELHAWDLTKGMLIGRWRSLSAYTSMCYSGNRIFMSRQTAAGPVIDTVTPPPLLASLWSEARTRHWSGHPDVRLASNLSRPAVALGETSPGSRYQELQERKRVLLEELARIDSLRNRATRSV